MKILLVEDDGEVRNTLLDALQRRNHTVVAAASAEEALEGLPGDFELVICDVLLKGMDGVTLLERVNAMTPRVPVVMITGFGDPEVAEICRKRGAAGFLSKPFSVHRLTALVEDIKREGRARA